MQKWKLEDAKNGFSELVRRAMEHEPQLVTRNGRDAVVVVSASDYEKLIGSSDLVSFLRESPLGDLELDRAPDLGRETTL